MGKLVIIFFILLSSSNLVAFEGKVHTVNRNKVMVATMDSSKIRVGILLYVIQDHEEIGIGRATAIFHSKVEMNLIKGYAANECIVTDKEPAKENQINSNEAHKALIEAAKSGNLASAKIAINAGAGVNAPANDGRTALMYASQNGHIEIVRLLIAAGADVNAKEISGRSALFLSASDSGSVDTIRYLIEAGAEVNATDNYGLTALIISAQNGRTEIVRLLIEKHADVNAKTRIGMTAQKHALANRHAEVFKLLRAAGAIE